MIIYKAINLKNNKVYIGLTETSLETRIKRHYYDSKNKKKNYYFMNALRKYNKEDWKWEVIDNALNLEQLSLKEKFWIKFHNSLNDDYGYNRKEGGKYAKLTEEIKKKMSESKKGNKHPFFNKHHKKESKEKISLSLKGKKHTKETKNKMSKNRKGSNNAFFGKRHSENIKQKLSILNKGKKIPIEQIINTANKNKKDIIDLNTNKIYHGYVEITKELKICQETIWKHLKNKVKNPRFKYLKETK
jgi:hypothetical protein